MDNSFGVVTGFFCGVGIAWTAVAIFLWFIDVIRPHRTWNMWPLWVGPLIAIASPLISAALHLPLLLFLPCILFRTARERRQQRVAREAAVRMEEGRRTNQIYIDAANAEAARLAAERLALERAGQPEMPRQTDGVSTALPPTTDAKENNLSPSNQCMSDASPSAGVAEPQATEMPVPTPTVDTTSVIAPPAPAHVEH